MMRLSRRTIHYPNGDTYVGRPKSLILGETIHDLPNGEGTLFTKTKDRYKGGWKEGLMHGQGNYYYANGEFYKGAWYVDPSK